MATNIIVYEQPLNERIRTFLRLEFLFAQTLYHLQGKTPWDSRAALSGLIDIINIFQRADLKTEVMKELERQISILNDLANKPGVDQTMLDSLLDEMDTLTDQLYAMQGQIGQELKQNDFLNSIKQRSSIPGGTCDFDLPYYHHWLEQSPEKRERDLRTWLGYFETVNRSINLLLRLIRESTMPTQETADEGFYQKVLDPSLPCQLVRVFLPAPTPYFTEISGGKHRFTVRFMEPTPDGRATQTEKNVAFEMSCCTL